MYRCVRTVMTACALAAALYACGGVGNAYTDEDVQVSKADPIALKEIANDTATPDTVRWNAIYFLSPQDKATYLDKAPVKGDPMREGLVMHWMGGGGILPLEKYDDYLAWALETGGLKNVYEAQSFYITELLKQDKVDIARSEAKRLLGTTPPRTAELSASINRTAIILKNYALKNGKSIPEAIGEMNSYLEAINTKSIANHPFTQLPFPATSPKLTALQEGKSAAAALACLYAGQYDAAKAKAEALLALAATPGEVQSAVDILGAVANGKAGMPAAAKEVVKSQ